MLAQLSWNRAPQWGEWYGYARAAGLLVAIVATPGLGGFGWGFGVALGQCEMTWQEGEGVAGVHSNSAPGSVRVLHRWDPDGTGPKPEMLVLGFRFSIAGALEASNIAVYDGQTLQGLGGGVRGDGETEGWVGALGIFENDLIVGGDFAFAGGTAMAGIARWNGEKWSDLGGGITRIVNGKQMPGYVGDVATWLGRLVAVGPFEYAGGLPARRIAVWDGVSWAEVGGGIASKPLSVASYGPLLYVGGSFYEAGGQPMGMVACWDGNKWDSLLGGGKGQFVSDMVVHDGKLFAAGNFYSMGGTMTGGVAVWDGTAWTSFQGVKSPNCYAIGFPLGIPVIVGSLKKMERWEDGAWVPAISKPFAWNMYTVVEYQDHAVVGGEFQAVDNVGAVGTARWDGRAFTPLVMKGWNAMPLGLHAGKEGVYATGSMLTVGGKPAEGVGKWDGQSWSPIGHGLMAGGAKTMHHACEYAGDLHVSGDMNNVKVGTEIINGIARWDGVTWHGLGAGIMGDVQKPMLAADGLLYVGGSFIKAGGLAANRVARWDGTQWHPLGAGLGKVGGAAFSADFAIHNGLLVVGGAFDTAGAVSTNNIATWDGTTWNSLGKGLGADVVAVQSTKGLLYAAQYGDSHAIACWNGSDWQEISEPDALIYDLGEVGGQLVATGIFSSLGGASASNIARWNGVQWSAIGDGLNAGAFRLATWQGELYVAGGFTKAGANLSVAVARLTCSCPTDCDASGSLNIDDFICFQSLYAVGDLASDCDKDGALTIDDFACFQAAYAIGC